MATVTPIEPNADESAPAQRVRKSKAGRKNKGTPPNPATEQQFFDKVRAIPAEDWGQRACMYCYVTEPLCNLKGDGTAKYLFKSDSPILDLQKIMQDYGSFKGYLTLNTRKGSEKLTNQIDRYDFEIYNPNYPPKIPRKVWIEDSRNEKWAALLPPEQQPAPAQNGQPNLIDTMRAVSELRRDIREELEGAQPLQPEPIDPVEALKGVASVMKEMKADAPKDTTADTIMKMMTLQQASQDANMQAIRAELAAARTREHELNMKLIDASKPQPQQESEITKLIVNKFIEDKIDGKEQAETVERRGKTTVMDIVRDVAVALPNSPFMTNVGNAFQIWMQMQFMAKQAELANKAPTRQQAQRQQPPALEPGPGVPEQQQPQYQAPPQPQPAPQAQQQEIPAIPMTFTPQQLADFLPQIIGPVCNTMEQGKDGYALAEWFQTQFGEMYFNILRNQGKEKIFAALQMSQYWGPFTVNGRPHSGFAVLEPQIKNMIEEFCNWPPPEDDEDEDGEDDNDGQPEAL